MFFYLLFVFKIKYDLVKDCFLYLFSVKAFLFHCLWKKIPFTYTKNVSKSVRNLQQLNKKVLEMWPKYIPRMTDNENVQINNLQSVIFSNKKEIFWKPWITGTIYWRY